MVSGSSRTASCIVTTDSSVSLAFSLLHLPHVEPLGTVCRSVLFTENTHYVLKLKKKKRKSRICIYSINAPHQNSDLYDMYVVFYVVMLIIFSMLCSSYVYMQTHVLFMSKNKDDSG